MAPILYHLNLSPPVRSVLLTARAIGVDLELKDINLFQGDQLKPEFIKINPQHCVPTLDDDGFILWDSHAISTYLIGKYAKDDSLYPKDLQKRALIDQRLHFDSSIIFPRLRAVFFRILFKGEKTIDQELIDDILQGLDFLEQFLEHDWLSGDQMTVADLCIMTGISSAHEALDIVDPSRFPKITAWLKRCETLPYYEEVNGESAKNLGKMIKDLLQK